MLSYLDEVYHTHDAKIPCAAMYFDFSKAFDSVRHDILVQKFAAFGFDDIFTALLISYLSNRFQCVKVRTSISTTLPVTSGVPQGSVLGPLLFILFINDLPDIFNHSNCFLFADDSKFICKTNCSDLKSDVDSFTHWCTQNGLKINKDKCNFIIFNGKFPDCIFVNNQPVHSINLLKDLGLLVSSDLTWSNHIRKKLLSSNKSFHFIKRSIPYHIPLSVKLMLINTCVKSILLYASPVWSPSLTMLRKLENFNRKCLTWVTGHLPYLKQLSLTNSLPISFTLIFNDLILFHKMLNGDSELPFAAYYYFKVTTSRSSTLMKVKPARIWSTETFFTHRTARAVNYMLKTTEIDFFTSLRRFRSTLKDFLLERSKLFNRENSCTWFLKCRCSFCRS